MGLSIPLDDPRCAVRAAIIHDQHFVDPALPVTVVGDFSQKREDPISLVMGRNDD
jgi:hypothetical protein